MPKAKGADPSTFQKGLLHWDLPPVRQSLSLFWQGTVRNGVI